MFKLLLKQNPAPEPDVQQPFYSPVSQRTGTNNNTVSNHEPANHETTDENDNDNENDGLIDEDSTTPQQQEPYMRATRTVSFND